MLERYEMLFYNFWNFNLTISTKWYIFLQKRSYNRVNVHYVLRDKYPLWVKFQRVLMHESKFACATKEKSQQETSCAERRRPHHASSPRALTRPAPKEELDPGAYLVTCGVLLNIWASARCSYYVLNIHVRSVAATKCAILERSRLIHIHQRSIAYSHPDLSQMLPACSHFVHSA